MDNQSPKNPRPTFLTVVCIISFVGLGWGIINNLSTLAFSSGNNFMYSMVQDNLEMALSEAHASDPATAAFLEKIFDSVMKLIEKLPLFATLGLVCSLIALAGVIMMWNLKKIGFYLYTAAKVIMLFIPVILIGFNFMSAMISISMMIGAALFITLYGLNLKAMK